MEKFKGRALIRKVKVKNSTTGTIQTKLLICGIFESSEDESNYSDMDEMWAVELLNLQSIKYEGLITTDTFSPEDFLENVNNIQSKDNWKLKE